MGEIITREELVTKAIAPPSRAKALPEPRVAINVRMGTNADIPFVDSLMKRHSKALAFLPTQALEGKVRLGHVLIAETSAGQRAGYLIGNDRYSSRDEVGAIFQVCVEPAFRRMLVGAHLLKKRFETSAYGCKLYCCWCAQDLTASNEFYESMGFVPLAFRAGSEKKSRMHIFWQKRIRKGDTTTPWWFPSETRGGLMDAARIALPIPPGLTWRDELPRIVPEEASVGDEKKLIEQAPRQREAKRSAKKAPPIEAPKPIRRNGLMFDIPLPGQPLPEATPAKPKAEKPKKVKKLAPELAAKARELRDRYMEQFNANPPALPGGKYELARRIDPGGMIEMNAPRLLEIEARTGAAA
jgi:ribosomal protein S18 acetylase RimI-like enzyme